MDFELSTIAMEIVKTFSIFYDKNDKTKTISGESTN